LVEFFWLGARSNLEDSLTILTEWPICLKGPSSFRVSW
jgi:hypothetical protein